MLFGLVKSNIESFLRQTSDSNSMKTRLISVYLDGYFINKLYSKMIIHKLIDFVRRDAFWIVAEKFTTILKFCISCTKEFLHFSGFEYGKFAYATMCQTHQN